MAIIHHAIGWLLIAAFLLGTLAVVWVTGWATFQVARFLYDLVTAVFEAVGIHEGRSV